ncbi:MAG: hypothetical protein JW838_01420 [Spirochaetes bacterium]|nr:hypothetical protein [Spirochaetota bacterium]
MTPRTWLPLMLVCSIFAGSAFGAAEETAPPAATGEKDRCLGCHDGLGGDEAKPVGEWRSSVHAGGKKCFLCHRGNPDADDRIAAHAKKDGFIGRPDNKAVPGFCGREGCHSIALEQFQRSPHYQSVMTKGVPHCGTCHGSHAIRKSSVGIIDEKACAICHTPETIKENVAMIAEIDRGIAEIDSNIRFMEDKHADVRVLRDRLDSVRRIYHQLVHVFSRTEIETSRRVLNLEIAGLGADARAKVSSIRRLDALYISMLIVGLAIIAGVSTYTLVMYGRRKKL